MPHSPMLKTYYQGLLMGIDTFSQYQRQAFSPQQSHSYESILRLFEAFKLETAHAIESADQPLPHGLAPYQSLSAFFVYRRIKTLKGAEILWQASAQDYHKGLKMMERYLYKHQQKLPGPWSELIISQIHQAYTLGGQLHLLNFPEQPLTHPSPAEP